MKKVKPRKKILIYSLVLALAAMLAAYLSIRFLLSPARIAAETAAAIENVLDGVDVRIGAVAFDFPQTVILEDIDLARAGQQLAEVDALHVSVDLASLLAGRLSVTDVSVTRPVIYIRQDATGWNVSGLFRENNGLARAVAIQSISITDGRIATITPERTMALRIDGTVQGLTTEPLALTKAWGTLRGAAGEKLCDWQLGGRFTGAVDITAGVADVTLPLAYIHDALAGCTLTGMTAHLGWTGDTCSLTSRGALRMADGTASIPFTADCQVGTSRRQLGELLVTIPGVRVAVTGGVTADTGPGDAVLEATIDFTGFTAADSAVRIPSGRITLAGQGSLGDKEFGGTVRIERLVPLVQREPVLTMAERLDGEVTFSGQYRTGLSVTSDLRLQAVQPFNLACARLELDGALGYVDGEHGATLLATLQTSSLGGTTELSVRSTGEVIDATLTASGLQLVRLAPFLSEVRESAFGITAGTLRTDNTIKITGLTDVRVVGTSYARGLSLDLGEEEWAGYDNIDVAIAYDVAGNRARRDVVLRRADMRVNDELDLAMTGQVGYGGIYFDPHLTFTAGPARADKLLKYLPLAFRETLAGLELSGQTGVRVAVEPAATPGEYSLAGELDLLDFGLRCKDSLMVSGINGSLPLEQVITTRYIYHDTSASGYQYEDHAPNVSITALRIGNVTFDDLGFYGYLKDNILRIDRLAFNLAGGRFHKGSFSADFRAGAPRFAMLLSFDHMDLGRFYRAAVGATGEVRGSLSGTLSAAWEGERIEHCRGEIHSDTGGMFDKEVMAGLKQYANPRPPARVMAIVNDYHYEKLTIGLNRMRALQNDYTDVILQVGMESREIVSEFTIQAPLKPLFYYLKGDAAALEALEFDVAISRDR